MYTITGVTGHVGGAAAESMLSRGAAVRVTLRNTTQSEKWVRQGAEVATADFDDPGALSAAMRGSHGAFVMLPTIPTSAERGHLRIADSIAQAVSDSGIPHVVLLSSIGADLPDGTGPIRWLHHLENLLRQAGPVLSAIRSWHFQEKVEMIIPAALDDGVYPVFGDTADNPTPMIATRDIGALVADLLLHPPATSEVIDLDGPSYTEREVAAELSAQLGKPLDVVTIPRPGWIPAMLEAGLPEPLARELAALYGAEADGLFQSRGDREHVCTTRIDDTLRHVLKSASGPVDQTLGSGESRR